MLYFLDVFFWVQATHDLAGKVVAFVVLPREGPFVWFVERRMMMNGNNCNIQTYYNIIAPKPARP